MTSLSMPTRIQIERLVDTYLLGLAGKLKTTKSLAWGALGVGLAPETLVAQRLAIST